MRGLGLPKPSMTLAVRGWSAVRPLLSGARDAILPPTCLKCRAVTQSTGGLCAACWPALNLTDGPHCPCCGVPFPHATADGLLCADCTTAPPAYRQARAALTYDAETRPLFLAFKHGDRLEGSASFGAWMARAAGPLLTEAEVIVPVPLHRRRLRQRRYNQAALLAQALGRVSGHTVAPDALVRVRDTPSQAGRDKAARRRNVRKAFAVRPGQEGMIAGRRILVVDDVLTTGATVNACARTLLDAGASAVDIVTLGRARRQGS